MKTQKHEMHGHEIQNSYDVIIAGLGTAGAIALYTAAKRGLKALGIEALNAMGGAGTLGAVNGYYYGSPGGVFEDLNAMEKALRKDMYIKADDSPGWDTKAYVLEREALKHGAQIVYESRITKVHMQGKTVTGVRLFSEGRQRDINCKILLDCTGEAAICHMAGCATAIGRELDGQTQPYSNMAIVKNKEYVYSLNKDSGYVNQWDSADLAEKIISSTALLGRIAENRRDCSFLANASLLGVRQGRTIIGEEMITLKGLLNNERVSNPIFYAFANIDNHGKDTAFEDELLLDWYVAAGLWGICTSVAVPMGALIPKGYKGILAAGRCLSVDHNISPLVRMKSDMEKCGEAAAEMAYLAITDGGWDIDKLSRILSESSCLDEDNNIGFVNDGYAPVHWITDFSELKQGLMSDKPGIAIWSAKQLGDKAISLLTECLDSDDILLRKNAAIALGLIGDLKACPQLRAIAAARDTYVPKTGLKYNYMHGVTAVYLLGRLRDKDSVDILLDIIRQGGSFDTASFVPDELYASENDVRFQYLSYALTALGRISNRYPELNPRIISELTGLIEDKVFSIKITLKMNPYIEYDMENKMLEYINKTWSIREG